MKNHNCYTCTFRQNVLDSTHSSYTVFKEFIPLKIAATKQGSTNPLGILVNKQTGKKLGTLIELNPVGTSGGWAIWSINYDPTWIKSCKMYTPTKEQQNS